MGDALIPVSLAVDAAAIHLYAAISDDPNPIHVDPEFAARTPFGRVIAHGTMSLNLICRAFELTMGPEAAEGFELDIRFKAPVFIGDVVTAGGRSLDGSNFEVWVRKQDGSTVIEGTASIRQTVGSATVAGAR